MNFPDFKPVQSICKPSHNFWTLPKQRKSNYFPIFIQQNPQFPKWKNSIKISTIKLIACHTFGFFFFSHPWRMNLGFRDSGAKKKKKIMSKHYRVTEKTMTDFVFQIRKNFDDFLRECREIVFSLISNKRTHHFPKLRHFWIPLILFHSVYFW